MQLAIVTVNSYLNRHLLLQAAQLVCVHPIQKAGRLLPPCLSERTQRRAGKPEDSVQRGGEVGAGRGCCRSTGAFVATRVDWICFYMHHNN